jgi:hypothetical protein
LQASHRFDAQSVPIDGRGSNRRRALARHEVEAVVAQSALEEAIRPLCDRVLVPRPVLLALNRNRRNAGLACHGAVKPAPISLLKGPTHRSGRMEAKTSKDVTSDRLLGACFAAGVVVVLVGWVTSLVYLGLLFL